MNRLYLEAPNYISPSEIKDWERTVFLAGSITGAENWQIRAKDKLLPYFTVFNPRRENYNIGDKSQERIQISWEHNYLNQAAIVLFYFSFETFAPITLLELGALLEQSKITPWKKIYICIHPDYKRKNDVIIQTELRNPTFSRNIFDNLDTMLDKIIEENTKIHLTK